VHDAIYTEVHKDDLVKAIKIIKTEMENPIKGFNVPLVAEVKTGLCWGKMQKWSNGNGH
jgi:DNA polymerase I-like protein with 3'-5' exonuclease and polymerase domains